MERAVEAALAAQGLKKSPDPEPEQVFFIPSDQYSFVQQGIPALFPWSGWQDETGSIAKNRALADWWTKNRYHLPSDECDPKSKYEGMAKLVRTEFIMALAVDSCGRRWATGACALSVRCVCVFIEQHFGPHMAQNSALLKASWGSVSSCFRFASSGSSERANCWFQSKA